MWLYEVVMRLIILFHSTFSHTHCLSLPLSFNITKLFLSFRPATVKKVARGIVNTTSLTVHTTVSKFDFMFIRGRIIPELLGDLLLVSLSFLEALVHS